MCGAGRAPALYRALLRYADTLTLTDPAYFRRRVAQEFRRNRTLTDPDQIAFAYRKGQALLKRLSVV